jgi:predicted enzyme related to lactoylglutathione lyase
MPPPVHDNKSSASRLFILALGLAFLLFNASTFLQNYLLKHSALPIQATVSSVSIIRHRGGVAYAVEYGFDLSGRHFAGTGLVTQKTFTALQPQGPLWVRYVPSIPSISETVEMSHNDTSLFLTLFVGFPVSLFILFVTFRKPPSPVETALPLSNQAAQETESPVELPNTVKGIAFMVYPVTDMKRAREFYESDMGLKVARDFRGEWVEYHLWDSCFAITTMTQGAVKPSSDSGGSIAFEVPNVDAWVQQLRDKNIQIKLEPFSTPACRMAVVLDPEGNALTLHQRLLQN